jgi:hypothetical protein
MAGGIREDPPGVQWIDSVPGFRCAQVSTAASRSQGSILAAAAISPNPRVVSNAGAAKFPGRFLALQTQTPGVGRKGETSKAPGRLPSARWRGDGWGRKAGGNRPDGAKTGSSTPGLHANGACMRMGLACELGSHANAASSDFDRGCVGKLDYSTDLALGCREPRKVRRGATRRVPDGIGGCSRSHSWHSKPSALRHPLLLTKSPR